MLTKVRICSFSFVSSVDFLQLTLYIDKMQRKKWPILHESPQYIYINKPDETKVENLVKDFPKLHLIHRLDTNTSGVLALAKNKTAANHFRIGSHQKIYLGICEGNFPHEQFTQKFHLMVLKDKVLIKKSDDSKECSHDIYKIIGNDKFSAVFVSLLSGRKHQIRAGLHYLKFPLIGDQKYGSGKFFSRQALHAYALKIEGEPVVQAPLDEKFCSALQSYCKIDQGQVFEIFAKLKSENQW